MTDPVLRVLTSRQTLAESGYSRSLLLSGVAHLTTASAIIILTLLTPARKLINVELGFAVPLPKGGGGMPAAKEPTEAPPAPEPVEAPKAVVNAPAVERLIKPEKAAVKTGLAPVDAKKNVKMPRRSESREIAISKLPAVEASRAISFPTPGPANSSKGLDFLPQTPGVANGSTGASGALGFYLAAAQNRIWATWARQLKPDFSGSVKVSFTIHRDGSIDQVEIIESSGSLSLDRLAERAVLSTQLGPLPNSYEKDTLLIHAIFKPVS